MIIVGGGLSGLIAAHVFPKATVMEAQPEGLKEVHKAVLRFRDDQVAKLVGIPFQPVTVRKGIWYKFCFVDPNIRFANMYSLKTNRTVMDRSIWNQEPAKRFVAPEDLWVRLVEQLGSRVSFDCPYAFNDGMQSVEPVINTAPMPIVVQKVLGIEAEFKRTRIHVARLRLKNVNVHQTVYFPQPDFPVYRATVTGSTAILESTQPWEGGGESWIERALFPFCLEDAERSDVEFSSQEYGKIVPVDGDFRRGIIMALTQRNIYSLGRFATWRNILLDDLPKDLDQIRRLMASNSYEKKILAAQL